jgi:hypothetical protein
MHADILKEQSLPMYSELPTAIAEWNITRCKFPRLIHIQNINICFTENLEQIRFINLFVQQ